MLLPKRYAKIQKIKAAPTKFAKIRKTKTAQPKLAIKAYTAGRTIDRQKSYQRTTTLACQHPTQHGRQ